MRMHALCAMQALATKKLGGGRRLTELHARDDVIMAGHRRSRESGPLTVDNVVEAVDSVKGRWRDLGKRLLGEALHITTSYLEEFEKLSSNEERLRSVIHMWLPIDPYASWRRIIQTLDGIGEHELAGNLHHRAEPVTDDTFTVHNVTAVLESVQVDPSTLAYRLLSWQLDMDQLQYKHATPEELRKAVIDYHLTTSPYVSWQRLAGVLCYWKYPRALEAMQKFLHGSADPTLTLDNLLTVLEEVPDEQWEHLNDWLGVPESVQDRFERQCSDDTRKRESLQYWLHNKPLPSWKCVAKALFLIGEFRVRKEVERKYLKTESRRLFQEAMKHGHVRSLVGKMLFMGAAGSGKTSSKHIILNEDPPTLRISTPCAERPVRVIRIEVDGLKWRRLQPEEEKCIVVNIMKARSTPQELQPPSTKTATLSADLKVQPESQLPFTPGSKSTIATPPSPTTRPTAFPGQAPSTEEGDVSSDIAVALESLSTTEDEFVRLMEQSSGSEALMQVELVQITDSGGQPQFHEVLPVFLRRTSAYVFVLKLSECLDAHPLVEYYDESGRLVSAPYHAAQTNQNILQHCIRTMRSYRCTKGGGKPAKIIIIGTHKDKEHECSETREVKNQKLAEMLLSSFQEEVVYYQLPHRELIFPLNARSPREEEQRIGEKIRRLIMTECLPEPVDIPLGWYGLEISLREIAKALGRDVMSKSECFEAAHRLHLNEKSFDAALEYLDELNVICYYPDILPGVVFCSPQVPVDKLTEVVEASYELGQGNMGMALTGEWQKFRDHGLVSVEFLSRECFCKHYAAGLFTPADLVKLFRDLLILADFSDSELFVPCLLRILNDKEVAMHRVSSSSPAAPFVLLFPHSGGPLLGVFCSLMVFLLSPDNHFPSAWKLLLDSSAPACLYRNCVVFTIPRYPGTITLIDSFAFFEVHIEIPTSVAAKVLSESKLCLLVREALSAGLSKAASALHYNSCEPEFSFVCPCGEGDVHPATVGAADSCWICSRNPQLSNELTENQTPWLSSASSSDLTTTTPTDCGSAVPRRVDRPKFQHLRQLKGRGGRTVKVIEQVAPEWEGLAYTLDFCPAVVRAVRRDTQDCASACTEVLYRWVGGAEGTLQPVSWVTLIECLRDCSFSTLARDLENALL